MDYEPRLLKAGFFTLIAALAVVALLVLPGRVGAASLVWVEGPPVIGSMSCRLIQAATVPVIEPVWNHAAASFMVIS